MGPKHCSLLYLASNFLSELFGTLTWKMPLNQDKIQQAQDLLRLKIRICANLIFRGRQVKNDSEKSSHKSILPCHSGLSAHSLKTGSHKNRVGFVNKEVLGRKIPTITFYGLEKLVFLLHATAV